MKVFLGLLLHSDMYWFDSVEVAFTRRSVIPEPLAGGFKIPFSIVLRIRSAFWNSFKRSKILEWLQEYSWEISACVPKCLQMFIWKVILLKSTLLESATP